MPITAAYQFSVGRLLPFMDKEDGCGRVAIRLASNKTFSRGMILALVSSASCVQTLTGSTSITGGTYTISIFGIPTTALNYNDNAATVQAACRLLPGVNGANLTVTGGALNSATPFTFTFTGNLANLPIPDITVNTTLLTGSQVVTQAQTTYGVSQPSYDQYSSATVAQPTVTVVPSAQAGGSIPDGTYRVYYTGYNTYGETVMATSTATVTLSGGNNTIRVAAMTGLPAGLTGLNVYIAGLSGGAGYPTFLGTIVVTGTSSAQTNFAAVITDPTTLKSPPTVNTAYTSAANTAALILEYDCKTDVNGNIALSSTNSKGEHGETQLSISAYYEGEFATTDLIGLDAKAINDLQGRVMEGTLAKGVFTF